MTELHEKLWDFDQVEPGQSGSPTVVLLTSEHITRQPKIETRDTSLPEQIRNLKENW